MEIKFEEVAPPAKAPWQEIGETLGLAEGLRAEKSKHGQWRCACCSKMQPDNAWQVWVPDSVSRNDPAWSVTEAARQNAYNGHLSGWCLSCAPKAGDKTAEGGRPFHFPSLWLGMGIGTVLCILYVLVS